MTASDRKTLLLAVRNAIFDTYGQQDREQSLRIGEAVADALLTGLLAPFPGDGEGMPEEAWKQAYEAALNVARVRSTVPAHEIVLGATTVPLVHAAAEVAYAAGRADERTAVEQLRTDVTEVIRDATAGKFVAVWAVAERLRAVLDPEYPVKKAAVERAVQRGERLDD